MIGRDQPKSTPPFRSFFPCLDRIEGNKKSNRTATLRGADWELKLSVELKCLPERDVFFSTRIENPLIPRPMITRTRLWITKDNDQIYARVLQSGGSIEQQLTAIGFATNQKCTHLRSKNCRILLSPPSRID
jgi:hypothetical protein